MSASLRDGFTVVIVAALVLFTNLGSYPLFDEDEPKNAVCGREMFERSDWVVPTFNEALRTDKPILIYWLMLSSFHVFGVSEFSARFGSALLSLGTALGTCYLGRKLYDRQVGLLAGIVVVTSLMFSAVGRAVTPDATLVCCLTWCFCAFVSKRQASDQRQEGQQEGMSDSAPGFPTSAMVLSYACMGLAMLAKGPVGFLLPCLVIGMFGLCRLVHHDLRNGSARWPEGNWRQQLPGLIRLYGSPFRFARVLWAMKLWIGIPVAFGIALPWYVLVGIRTNGAWLEGFLGGHNVNRFLSPMENHRGLFIYYIPVLFAGTFPWSVLLPTAIRELTGRIRKSVPGSDSDVFLACWTLTWLVFFSIAQTKLPNYILPIYPAVAVIVSRSLVQWMRQAAAQPRNFLLECRVLSAMGIVMLLGLGITMSILLPAEWALSGLGLIPVITGAVAFHFACRQQRQRAVVAWTCGAVLLAMGITSWAPLALARYQDSPYFAQAARASAESGAPEMATFQVFQPSLVFYHGRRLYCPNEPADLVEFFNQHAEGVVLTRADRLDQLPPELSGRLVEVARQRRFLRTHDLVLLGQPTFMSTGHTVSQPR